MSEIYIPGISMPEDGWHKVIKIFSDGTVVSYYDSTELGKAIPVPDHGRLIDADALSAKLNMMLAMAFGEGNTAFHFAYRSLGKVVENAPTIIPASGGDAE